MAIDIIGLGNDRVLRTRITSRMSKALGQLRVKPVNAHVAFIDENGPKGGIDTRCTLTVRLPYRPTVRVEHIADAPRAAFDQAFDTLERQLVRYREVDRDRRRRPKKYFAAKRLLTGEPSSPPPAERRTRKRA